MNIDEFRKKAIQLDENDSLKKYREKFFTADEKIIYLDGNSLGRLPLSAKQHMHQVIENEWGTKLISSWNDHWLPRMKNISAKISELLGAQNNEVLLADSTSLNLFKLLYAVLNNRKNKLKIITDDSNFPTDIYIIESLINLLNANHELVIIKSIDGVYPDIDKLKKDIDAETAVVTLSHVTFKASYMYNMKEIADYAREKNVPVVWDLSHSVGAVPLYFTEWGIDYAVGCTYKYLNGGPGASAFLYVRKELQDKLTAPVWGWFGDSSPFDFRLNFQSSSDISKFNIGTPPILSVSAIEPALDITIEAGMETLREKSKLQSEYFLELFYSELEPRGFQLGSPKNFEQRGSHVSIKHKDAYKIASALINSKKLLKNVIPDFRKPDNIRVGIAPLYNSFNDLFECAELIKQVVDEKIYLEYSETNKIVT